MATSTLVQLLEAGQASDTSNRRQLETFLSSGAITKGDWVELDASKTGADRALYVKECATVATKGNAGAFGVALETVAADEQVRVVVAGYVAEALVAAATVAGSALVGPIGTAGRAEIEVPGTTTGSVCGIALDVDTANIAPVFVIKKY
jgi:hypothetical protein